MEDLQKEGFAPFASEDVLPPHNSHWAARRELAQQLRELTELAVSTDADETAIRAASAELGKVSKQLREQPRLIGSPAILRAGRHGGYAQINHELNALGGWSNPLAPGLNMWIEDKEVHGQVRCHHAYEGPPGFVHGGYVAAIFDQFLGMAQIAGGNPGMTGSLTVHYHKPTPLETDLTLNARVTRTEGRKTIVHGEMRAGDIITATCEGLFVRPSRAMYEIIAEEEARQAKA